MDLRKSDTLAGTSYWIEDIQKIYIYIYIFFLVPKISQNFWIIFQFSPVFTGLKALPKHLPPWQGRVWRGQGAAAGGGVDGSPHRPFVG